MDAKELGLDYFKVYDVQDRYTRYPVALQGQFEKEPKKADLLALQLFANAASKNDEPVVDWNAHLAGYLLRQQVVEPVRVILIENQFGKQRIVIGRAIFLFVPSQKGRESKFPEALAHFKVYQVLRGEPVNRGVVLKDQFGTEKTEVLQPIAFAVPVTKWYRQQVFKPHNTRAHLTFYRIDAQKLQKEVPFRNQFSTLWRSLSFISSVALAVPSLKLEVKEQ